MNLENIRKLELATEHLDSLLGEVVCEVVRPSGCRALSAQNLRGTGYVARDFAWEELSGELADGTTATVRARFAGLEGYLLSKCVADAAPPVGGAAIWRCPRYTGTAESAPTKGRCEGCRFSREAEAASMVRLCRDRARPTGYVPSAQWATRTTT